MDREFAPAQIFSCLAEGFQLLSMGNFVETTR
jgi:hypothetical protein